MYLRFDACCTRFYSHTLRRKLPLKFLFPNENQPLFIQVYVRRISRVNYHCKQSSEVIANIELQMKYWKWEMNPVFFPVLKTLREIPGSVAAKPSIYAGGRIGVYPDDNLDIREPAEQCSFVRPTYTSICIFEDHFIVFCTDCYSHLHSKFLLQERPA